MKEKVVLERFLTDLKYFYITHKKINLDDFLIMYLDNFLEIKSEETLCKDLDLTKEELRKFILYQAKIN